MGALLDFINSDLVATLGIQVYALEEPWMLHLADDNYSKVDKYVWVNVNVDGVCAPVKAYVAGSGTLYDILLSRKWMHRVKAVEDHGAQSFSIEGPDGKTHVIRGVKAETSTFAHMQTESDPAQHLKVGK